MPRTIRARKKLSKRRGSLLIDALLAIVIFGAVVGAFSTGVIEGQRGTVRGGNRVRATFLAEEGLEAVRSIRDRTNGYVNQIATKTLGQVYGVQLTGANWSIIGSATTIDAFFTRAISFTNPNNDSDQRVVTSTVTWAEPTGQSRSVSLSTFITNWREDPLPPSPDWTRPQLKATSVPASIATAKLEKVEVSGNYAYAAASNWPNGIAVFDISNTASPTFIQNNDTANGGTVTTVRVNNFDVYDIAVQGSYAYVATANTAGELSVVDISTSPPEDIACCVRTINLDGTGFSYGISITGTGLFVTHNVPGDSTKTDLYVFDIGDDPTLSAMFVSSPPLISDRAVELMYDSSAATERVMRGVTGTGSTGSNHSNTMPAYAYVATDNFPQHLTVVQLTGSTITGGGQAQSAPNAGLSVAVFNTGGFLGTVGNGSLFEIFSFGLGVDSNRFVHSPSGTISDRYDLGGSGANDSPAESSVAGNDLDISQELGLLFIATNIKKDCTPTCVNHYLHILDAKNVRNISSPSQVIFNGYPLTPDINVAAGHAVQNGLFYRESDNTLFMVGGDPVLTESAELIIVTPKAGTYLGR